MEWQESRLHQKVKQSFLFVFSSVALIALCTTLGFRWIWRYDIGHDTPSVLDIPPNPYNHWVDTFAAAPQYANASELLPSPFNETRLPFKNTTIRQTVQLTTGGQLIRLRLSNAFGLQELPITRVTIAIPKPCCGEPNFLLGSRNLDAATLQTVAFSGEHSISIPRGGLIVSDPVNFKAHTGSTITINIYIREGQHSEIVTSHLVSRTKSWFVQGDYTNSPDLDAAIAVPVRRWFIISGIEVYKTDNFGTLVVFGDSLTEARKNRINSGIKWPRMLYRRLQAQNMDLKDISVINLALGGNQILADGKGPSAISRLDRDVMSHSGLTYFLVYQGINDIGHANGTVAAEQTLVVHRMITYYQQIITRLHTIGVLVFGGTISPFICPGGFEGGNSISLNATREATRQTVNDWIRTSHSFDAVIDFDAMLRSPNNATLLARRFDSGDCLHFNDLGSAEIAAMFPVEVFRRFRNGVHKVQ